MSSSVIYQDAGLQKLHEDLNELRRMRVKIGYQPPEGRAKYGSGITVAKLAAVHEFGGSLVGGKHGGGVFHTSRGNRKKRHKWGGTGMPARSFMRSTIEEKGAEIAACQERELTKVIEGKATPVQVMSAIGSFVVRLIRAKLKGAAGWAAPLSPETVAAKGHAKPLEETDLLALSLSWKVTKGKQELARGNQ